MSFALTVVSPRAVHDEITPDGNPRNILIIAVSFGQHHLHSLLFRACVRSRFTRRLYFSLYGVQ